MGWIWVCPRGRDGTVALKNTVLLSKSTCKSLSLPHSDAEQPGFSSGHGLSPRHTITSPGCILVPLNSTKIRGNYVPQER